MIPCLPGPGAEEAWELISGQETIHHQPIHPVTALDIIMLSANMMNQNSSWPPL